MSSSWKDFTTGRDGFADRLVSHPRLQALVMSLAAAACPQLSPEDLGIEPVLRLVSGPAPAGKPLCFHYDGSVVTMVVPISIPGTEPGCRGELILCPNRRPYPRSVITNVLQKSVEQNDVFRRRFERKLGSAVGARVAPLTPGNAYLFWGYRSYHATLSCPSNTLRATLILHCGVFQRDSVLLARAKSAGRALRDRRRNMICGPTQYRVLRGRA